MCSKDTQPGVTKKQTTAGWAVVIGHTHVSGASGSNESWGSQPPEYPVDPRRFRPQRGAAPPYPGTREEGMPGRFLRTLLLSFIRSQRVGERSRLMQMAPRQEGGAGLPPRMVSNRIGVDGLLDGVPVLFIPSVIRSVCSTSTTRRSKSTRSPGPAPHLRSQGGSPIEQHLGHAGIRKEFQRTTPQGLLPGGTAPSPHGQSTAGGGLDGIHPRKGRAKDVCVCDTVGPVATRMMCTMCRLEGLSL